MSLGDASLHCQPDRRDTVLLGSKRNNPFLESCPFVTPLILIEPCFLLSLMILNSLAVNVAAFVVAGIGFILTFVPHLVSLQKKRNSNRASNSLEYKALSQVCFY